MVRVSMALCALLLSTWSSPPEAAETRQDGRRSKEFEKRFNEDMRPNPPGLRLLVTVFETPIEASSRDEFSKLVSARQQEIQGRREGAQQILSSRWNMRWSWQTEVTSNVCNFKSVTVFVEYQTHYVRVEGPLALDTATVSWWKEQTDGMYGRHLLHLKEIRAGATQTQERLSRMTNQDCASLQREAASVAHRDVQVLSDRVGATLYNTPPDAD